MLSVQDSRNHADPGFLSVPCWCFAMLHTNDKNLQEEDVWLTISIEVGEPEGLRNEERVMNNGSFAWKAARLGVETCSLELTKCNEPVMLPECPSSSGQLGKPLVKTKATTCNHTPCSPAPTLHGRRSARLWLKAKLKPTVRRVGRPPPATVADKCR